MDNNLNPKRPDPCRTSSFEDKANKKQAAQEPPEIYQNVPLYNSPSLPSYSESFRPFGSGQNQNSQYLSGQPPNDINNPESRYTNPWLPGLWTRFPLLGIAALLGTVMCTFASVGILIISDNVPIDGWPTPFQPTVYLAIASSASGVFLGFALAQGGVISFWTKAKRGATLEELHQYWDSGSSVYAAIRGMTRFKGKIIGIACIMNLVTVLRDPFIQRASSVKNFVNYFNGTFQVHIAKQLPFGYTGLDTGRTSSTSILMPNFTDVIQGYTKNTAMKLKTNHGCGHSCNASIQGFGFGVNCSMTSIPYDMYPITTNESVTLRGDTTAFNTEAGLKTLWGKAPTGTNNTALTLNSTFMSTPTQLWNGSLASHLCVLRGGVVSYPVVIRGDTVSLRSTDWRDDTFIEDTMLDAPPYGSGGTIIGGFQLAANNLFSSTAYMQYGGAVGWIVYFQGSTSNSYLNPNLNGEFSTFYAYNMTWRDPMDDMVNAMRQIAFRTALRAAADNLTLENSTQVTEYQGNEMFTGYSSDYTYIALAVIVTLLGVIAIMPTYWGWWELGRETSMSPVEIAKAFGAPLLANVDSNATARQMLAEVGGKKVRYGEVTTQFEVSSMGGLKRCLTISEEGLVRRPTAGGTYRP
ncbi:MAG: hypothetical protein M1834_007083 [Cirrosporium novae-zelandiae]|nr:MAG: hypothetical protein M1834_007083 [Cirrosporium novae-zelandiae]